MIEGAVRFEQLSFFVHCPPGVILNGGDCTGERGNLLFGTEGGR